MSIRDFLRSLLMDDCSTAKELHLMTQALDHMTLRVAEATTVMESASKLIQGLAAAILADKDDPAALEVLASRLQASDMALSSAITQNTAAANLGTSPGTDAGNTTGDTGGQPAPTTVDPVVTTDTHPETGVLITTTTTTDPTTGGTYTSHTTLDPTTGETVPVDPETGEIVPPTV